MPQQVSINLGANPAGFIAGMRAAGASAEALDAKTAGLGKSLKTLGGAFVAFELVKGLVDATKAAGNFQAQITRLKTDANETSANLGLIAKGVISLSNATGTSTTDLNAGLYKIESAGIHGADALKVLKASAEGAKIGFADLTTVSDALTTAMVDYKIPASGAVATTNELIAAVSRGKTDLESLAGSLSTVAPIAHTAGIGLDETLGAMATMTAQGTPAAKAATYLAQTMKSIEAPTAKSAKELDAIGLSAADLSNHLGDRGLGGTLTIITDAIRKKMGASGEVMLANLQKLSGKTSDFQKILADVPPGMQSYVQALALGTGTTKTLQAVLELTGEHAATFAQNTADISAKSKHAGSDVADWAVIQKNFNQQLSVAVTRFENIGLTIGQKLLPWGTKFVGWLSDAAGWLGKYPGLVQGIAASLLGAGGLVVAWKAVNGVMNLYQGLAAKSIALRGANTLAIRAEAAAAEQGVVAMRGLTTAETTVGLRAPLGGALGRLGLAGGAAAGGETAAIGGMSAAALGAAIAAPIVLSLGSVFALYKIDQKNPIGKTDYKGGYAPGSVYVPGLGNPGGVDVNDVYKQSMAMATALHQQSPAFTGQDKQTRSQQEGQFQGLITGMVGEGKAAALTAEQVDQLVQAQNKLPAAMTNLTGLIKKQTDAFSVLNVAGQNAVVASENYQASIDGLNNSVKQNGTSLDITTAKGRANTDAIVAQAGAINEVDTAYFDAESKAKGYKTALGEVTTKLQGQKDALIQQATHLGISHDAAKKLVDEILKTPKQVTTDFQSPQLAAMSKKVADLQNQINELTGKPYYVTVGITTSGSLQSTMNQQVGHAPNGANAASGYAGGMGHATPQVKTAARMMAQAASDEVAKFNESQSPSKLYARHGYNTGTGLAKGAKDSTKHVAAAAKALATAATTTLRDELRAGLRDALTEWASKIASLKKSISKDQSSLSSWRGNRDQASQAAKGVFTSTGDLSQITGGTIKNWDGTSSTAPVTAADINTSLTATVAKDKQFLSDLNKAKKLGLKDPYLSQILGYGPDVGEPLLQAILSGGKSEVKTVMGLEGQINQYGNQAAKAAAEPFNKHIDGLTKELQTLNAQLKKDEAAVAKAKSISLTINASDSPAQLRKIEQQIEAYLGKTFHLKKVGG